MEKTNGVVCSFCGKDQDKCYKIIAGPGVYICDECINMCSDILNGEKKNDLKNEPQKCDFKIKHNVLPKPHEIKAYLDEYVIGQDDAKKALAVAVYNHYKRVYYGKDDVELQKSNVLLLGPTGVGKTLLAHTLAKFLDVPFAIADATTLTEAGYVGEDVENILLRLIQAADYDIEKAERGIIYIDELDKISRKSENPSITRDVSGEGVQQALLKIIEGTTSNVPPQGGRKHPQQEFVQIDTSNILFICGGAFEGLKSIVEKRKNTSAMGFVSDINQKDELDENGWMKEVIPHDIVKYGLIPELVGRIPVLTALNGLNKEALVDILTTPKNSLCKQYKKLFDLDKVDLEFQKEALEAIAQKAIDRGTGARGLRSIMEEILGNIMYDIPSDYEVSKVIITKETVEDSKEPLLKKDRNRQPVDIKTGVTKKITRRRPDKPSA